MSVLLKILDWYQVSEWGGGSNCRGDFQSDDLKQPVGRDSLGNINALRCVSPAVECFRGSWRVTRKRDRTWPCAFCKRIESDSSTRPSWYQWASDDRVCIFDSRPRRSRFAARVRVAIHVHGPGNLCYRLPRCPLEARREHP